ncbi:MAG: hypothetical protein JRI96_16755, partial [Deltaproteobacteria bacterium]|nr:hypothetical protein [Deltaproteobacteria bacterium]
DLRLEEQLKYPNPRNPQLKLDAYDKKHYYWDKATGYWRSREHARLVLGTWEDVKKSGGKTACPTDMKNHVAIRTTCGYSLYIFDQDIYSQDYMKEALERGEITRHHNNQLWIDEHHDAHNHIYYEPNACVAWDIAMAGWVDNHIWVYFTNEPFHDCYQPILEFDLGAEELKSRMFLIRIRLRLQWSLSAPVRLLPETRLRNQKE